ncbi:hypothetical protein B0A50_04379 [Salinomyces thailandicus]|uniref:Uncharacterized protein n=1 Tax=Salinomyces thailandicus TaxID=706561 RepID=A0A4V5N4K1_9PEZI|nr:hypothetical protein B0A50_04379 [Salinomyces thailandica]
MPQTATFDSASKNGAAYNEDALPAMPSWSNAPDRRVDDDDVEMEKMSGYPPAQQQSLLPKNDHSNHYYGQPQDTAGDLGAMHASPYQDYDQYRQNTMTPTSVYPPTTSPTSVYPPTMSPTSVYPPTYHTALSPTSTTYEPSGNPWMANGGYVASTPPSYYTRAPSIASQNPFGRKPVQGSWRDV